MLNHWFINMHFKSKGCLRKCALEIFLPHNPFYSQLALQFESTKLAFFKVANIDKLKAGGNENRNKNEK